MAKTTSGGIDRRALLGALAALGVTAPASAQQAGMSERTAYTFSFAGLEGGDIRMSAFAGRAGSRGQHGLVLRLLVATGRACRRCGRGFRRAGLRCSASRRTTSAGRSPARRPRRRRSRGRTASRFPSPRRRASSGPRRIPSTAGPRPSAPARRRGGTSTSTSSASTAGSRRCFPPSTDPLDARITVAVERELARRG